MSSVYDSTPWVDQDLPSAWDLDDPPIDEGGLHILLGSTKVVNNYVDMRLCIYVMDDIPAPQAFPLRVDSLESCFMVQRTQRENLLGSRVEWNVAFLKEPIPSTSTVFQQLEAGVRDLVIHKKNQLTPANIIEKTKIKELPPHLRSKPNIPWPSGHWDIDIDTSLPNTYESIGEFADALVARKRTGKQIVCVYARSQVAGRAGLRVDQREVPRPSEREEDLKWLAEIDRKVPQAWLGPNESGIIGRKMPEGAMDPLHKYLQDRALKRKRDEGCDSGHRAPVVSAGDWLTDEELEANMRRGTFGRETPSADERTGTSRKCARRDGLEGPSNAVDASAEQSITPGKSPRKKDTEALMGGQIELTDEELEALLKAGCFDET
ncbi:hypothetical protein LTS15_009357 [Exophiala xenobiotica]|nr:hypothetical protein LTS15_009357 [Exophiala xenobiotica]